MAKPDALDLARKRAAEAKKAADQQAAADARLRTAEVQQQVFADKQANVTQRTKTIAMAVVAAVAVVGVMFLLKRKKGK